jgi:hypothetical protein
MTTPDDLEAKAARREERQARRQARREEHLADRPEKPHRLRLSKRAEARLQSEPTRAPEPHVRYTGWGLLSPFERTKLPRRRDVKVTVLPQSKRRPWEYAS